MKVTQDMKLSYLPYLRDSYGSDKGAPIDKFLKKTIKLFNEKGYETDFCCSGHTDMKPVSRLKAIQHLKELGLPIGWYNGKGPECYVSFKTYYPNIGKKENNRSVIRLYSCGTLMGIKKACRKMYRIAKSL